MTTATYKDAGIDLDRYQESMSRLPRLMHRTYSPRVMSSDGGFAGMFRLDFANRLFNRDYQDPVLVAGADGAGTKVKVAQMADVHNTIGIDLVAMCANDVICCGAELLFFLDHVVMPEDDPSLLEQIVKGVSDGCVEADCALLGGETAIHPGSHAPGEYDVAGFCVGVVERAHIIDGKSIAPSDVVLGLAANGLHDNGYSLVRKVVFQAAGLAINDTIDELGCTVREELLRPTTIYARPIRRVLNYYKVKNVVHGIAHITGGGLPENLGRSLPDNVQVVLERDSWQVPAVFPWLQQLGDINDDEMSRVFNMGLGLALIVSAYYADNIQRMLQDDGLKSWQVGQVVEGARGVTWAE